MTYKELIQKLNDTLTEDELDMDVKIYLCADIPENYYKIGSVIVPTDGDRRGDPFMYISDEENY